MNKCASSIPVYSIKKTENMNPLGDVWLFGPVSVAWDEGKYFEKITCFLQDLGYRVILFDTLSIAKRDTTIDELLHLWVRELSSFPHPKIVGGAAFGGYFVQYGFCSEVFSVADSAIFISSPSIHSPNLDNALLKIIDLLEDSKTAAAIATLDKLVQPWRYDCKEDNENVDVTQSVVHDHRVRDRLIRGFSFLKKAYVVDKVNKFEGNIIHFVGDCSQMVREENIRLNQNQGSSVKVISGGGMRPHVDNWLEVQKQLKTFFKGESAV